MHTYITWVYICNSNRIIISVQLRANSTCLSCPREFDVGRNIEGCRSGQHWCVENSCNKVCTEFLIYSIMHTHKKIQVSLEASATVCVSLFTSHHMASCVFMHMHLNGSIYSSCGRRDWGWYLMVWRCVYAWCKVHFACLCLLSTSVVLYCVNSSR